MRVWQWGCGNGVWLWREINKDSGNEVCGLVVLSDLGAYLRGVVN